MRLGHLRVSQSSARVIPGVDQLYLGEVQRPVAENPHVLVAEGRQVGGISFPDDRRRRIAAHVAADFHVVADLCGYPIDLERFLQSDHRQAYIIVMLKKKVHIINNGNRTSLYYTTYMPIYDVRDVRKAHH